MPPARAVTIATANRSNTAQRAGLVWDLPLRLFHWLLVLSLGASWATAEAGFEWTEQHFWLGYCALTLVLFRLLWGIWGTYHARYRTFLRNPITVWRSLPTFFSRVSSASTGHSPLGGYASVVLLVLVMVQAITGLFISDDIFYAGPLNGLVSSDLAGQLAQIHHLNFNLLQAAVVLHLLVMMWYRFGKQQNLISAMWHGRRDNAKPPIHSSKLVLALLLFSISVSCIVLLIYTAPEPPLPEF